MPQWDGITDSIMRDIDRHPVCAACDEVFEFHAGGMQHTGPRDHPYACHVIIEFESYEMLMERHQSKACQATARSRRASAECDIFSVEGLE
ncbi:MAG: DUF1330 domain-containing protein [Pseudomonadota bacterium]